MSESKMEIQDVTRIQIPKTMAAAPFLKHAALTPAQREYLYTIAASSGTTHVPNLITQHYMNILHRCIHTGHSLVTDDLMVTSVASCENEKVSSREEEDRGKINTAGHSGKSSLPKIPNRKPSTIASKQRKMKKHTKTSVKIKRSPRQAKIKVKEEQQQEEEEEEEEGLNDSLSDCLSLLSLGDWDDDSFSDL
ncbi:protein FAM216A [Anabas testudineus]|uniref:protein FAM216A n=1 Tax=Anabas testudineus TaxID=64144 RepID=UPI000E456336|nr:protein FAM216A [Anabas testudineus]